MGKETKFGHREVIFPLYPSLDIVEEAVQKLKDTYTEALDGVLMGGQHFRDNVYRKDRQLDLRRAQLISLFNYDWLKEGQVDETRVCGLVDELIRIGNESYIEGELVIGITPLHTDDFLRKASETVYGSVPNIVLYKGPNLIQRLGF